MRGFGEKGSKVFFRCCWVLYFSLIFCVAVWDVLFYYACWLVFWVGGEDRGSSEVWGRGRVVVVLLGLRMKKEDKVMVAGLDLFFRFRVGDR